MKQSGLGVWILAARPKTLPAALAPVMIGAAMAHAAGSFHLLSVAAAAVGAILIQIGTNFANDYFDFKSGVDTAHRLGPTRATQAGLVSPKAMKRATILVFLLALVVGIYLVYRGGWPIVFIGLLAILFGILYTAGPFPLATTGLADPFVLIFFGPVAVGGTYFVQVGHINSEVIVAGLAPGLFSTAILTVNNLRDIVTDRESRKKTLAVRFGPTFARGEFIFAIAAACVIPIVLYAMNKQHLPAMLSSLVLLASIPAVRKVLILFNTPEFNDVLAATGKLLLLYSILFSVGWMI